MLTKYMTFLYCWLFTKMSNDFFRLLVSQVDSIVVTVDIHTKRKEGKNGKSMCHFWMLVIIQLCNNFLLMMTKCIFLHHTRHTQVQVARCWVGGGYWTFLDYCPSLFQTDCLRCLRKTCKIKKEEPVVNMLKSQPASKKSIVFYNSL